MKNVSVEIVRNNPGDDLTKKINTVKEKVITTKREIKYMKLMSSIYYNVCCKLKYFYKNRKL